MGTPNYYQESLEILLEILLEKLLSTEAGNKTKHALRAEARWRICVPNASKPWIPRIPECSALLIDPALGLPEYISVP